MVIHGEQNTFVYRMDRSGCLKQRASVEIMQFPTSFPGTYMSVHEQCRRFTGGPPCEVRVFSLWHRGMTDIRTVPEVIKLFFNSAEHKILISHKYKISRISAFIFQAQISLERYFSAH